MNTIQRSINPECKARWKRSAILLACSLLLAPALAFSQARDLRVGGVVIDDNNGNTVSIQVPPGLSSYTLTLPSSLPAGTYVLSLDPSGAIVVTNPSTMSVQSFTGSLTGDITSTGMTTSIADGAVTPAKLNSTGASSGDVLSFDGTNVTWAAPTSATVTHNSTLTGNGTGGSPLGMNLGNSNTWTANQTFAGTFLITSNSRIAMTNSDNNARDIRFQEPSGTGSQYIGLRAPSVTNNGNYVFPAVVGSAGQVLSIGTTNGIDSATMVWATPSLSGSAGGDLSGTYPNPTIAGDAVTSSHIADGTIVSADISASAAIPYSKLSLSNSIQNIDIVANAITTSKVANGTVTTSKLADSAVSGLKLLTYAVTNRHIADGAVTLPKVSTSGASAGQVPTYDGSSVVWRDPAIMTYGTVNAGATITVPNNTAVVRVIDDAAAAANAVTMPSGTDGQVLYIYNNDTQALTGSVSTASGAVEKFIYISSAWHLVN